VVFGLQGLIGKELPSKVDILLNEYFKISDLICSDCWCTNELYNFSELQNKLLGSILTWIPNPISY